MRTHIECFPCFIKQTIIALTQLTQDQGVHEDIVREALSVMQHADTSRPPAYTTTFIHRMIRDRLGQDPFEKVKDIYNNLALGLYPGLKDETGRSDDPLWTAARLAISGNVIDFGIFTSIDVDKSVRRSLESRIAVDDYSAFKESVSKAGSILYLLDNAGEIVFDRLLIEELCAAGKKVTAVVKGSPVLNDVTSADAVQVGLTTVCEVVDNGSDAIGTVLEWTSPEFQRQYRAAELIISKGQGNFETLSEDAKKTYFLFQSKCDVVSRELGLSPGSMLLKKS
jgi:hypothetical protein